ncbi:TRAP transporter permease [Sansalvadorimonas sp. 2012CJ34-2]|uniref:TRAP transporter permease n=1 Tax=Parendozoicomonas callyspongiae TaxID=2942213 RepID=A0ABT0PH47_9GAMM|nr:TRAP transporter permease [Sansalvadorimonas sp. 2012CJ34-2]MCL6270709.1 TRAP transporter permease [Sansalvadorimonas sp. 2012CJ34-2]
MSNSINKGQEAAAQIVNDSDTGARNPRGLAARILTFTALAWAIFQLWYASPLPFTLNFFILNDTEARAIHLAFAIFLSFTAFPALKRSPKTHIPVQDWILALLGAFSAAYIYLFYAQLAERPGAPITQDVVVSVIGMVLLLEATRRALGPPLVVVASVFLIYTFAGPYMPDIVAHKGASLNKAMSHFWLTTEGVFGVALGVSTNFVFLFVLFGALLEQAGAGQYFIRLSFSLLGHLKGGPAKAAVVSSGLSGVISGSSIANVVTTGTFTIPLMKRVGFPATKAGAIEVAASTNGQLTPPIMGAAAFLMVEYVGIPYIDVIRHAILPAAISYIALFYIVHLEAVKAGMQGMPRERNLSTAEWMMLAVGSFLMMCVLAAFVYFGIGWIKDVAGDASLWIIGVLTSLIYVGLLALAARYPDHHEDHELTIAPRIRRTALSGLHFLLPVVVLIWCIAKERMSPGLSAFWATLFMIIIVLTQHPILNMLSGKSDIANAFHRGTKDLFNGLISGSRNMIGIGVATAAAGIVVGTVTLTGIGQVMTEFVEFISGGSILLVLIFTAIISLILGMGLPTTANYIVVSSLMAPVIVSLGAAHGLIVPLIAVHLFVFYFGILADDTPPVGLAAYAAAAIAQANPIKTGIQGFTYDIRTAILPFMFIFNTQLLLIDIGSIWELLITIFSALGAMLVFAAATQGYWVTKTKWYETVGLLLIAFTLFRPGFWWDMAWPERLDLPATSIYEQVMDHKPGEELRLRVSGEDLSGNQRVKTILIKVGDQATAEERLFDMGLELAEDQGRLIVDNIGFASQAEKAGLDFDWEILSVEVPNDRLPKQLMFIPALLLLLLIYTNQRRRAISAPGSIDINKEGKKELFAGVGGNDLKSAD